MSQNQGEGWDFTVKDVTPAPWYALSSMRSGFMALGIWIGKHALPIITGAMLLILAISVVLALTMEDFLSDDPKTVVTDHGCFHAVSYKPKSRKVRVETTSGLIVEFPEGSYRSHDGHICGDLGMDPQ
jgi:hypothetical protein